MSQCIDAKSVMLKVNWTGRYYQFRTCENCVVIRKMAHRLVYEECFGPLPSGHVVMHKCDNGACVNPEHLEAGTQRDNMIDMRRKKRDAASRGFHNKAKLTVGQVVEIRSSTLQPSVLAKLYGLTTSGICHVKYRRTWKNV